jgi:DHA2 family multidrug resistance protein
MLVTCRILQGLTGGPMIPASQTLLVNLFPPNRASTGQAIFAMTAVIGPVLGPFLGGQICDHWTWPWIFLINLPVTFATAFFCWQLLASRDPPPQRNKTVDIIGFGLMVVWIGAVQMMLDRGPELDWFGSSFIIGAAIIAVLGFVAFIIWELTDRDPIVNLRVFSDPGFSIGVLVVCIGFGAFYGTVLLQPLWLQTNMGYTPAWAGFATMPGGMVVFLTSPFVAWLANRLDVRIVISMGLFAFAAALVWRAHFAQNVTFQMIIVSQALNGVCLAFFFSPAMTLSMGFLKPREIAAGAGLMAFTRATAMAFSAALTTTGWQNATIRNRVELVDRFNGQNVLDTFSALGWPHGQALSQIDTMVQSQAVMLATNDSYYMLALAMATGGACVWLAPRGRRRAVAAVAH